MRRIPRLRWEYLVAALIVVGVVLTSALAADTATTPPAKKATVAFGIAQAKTHRAGVTQPPIVPFIRTLSFTKASNKHCPCTPVFQMQRALKAAKFRPVHAKSTGVFGKNTRDQIAAFQRARRIAPSGVYGSRTHKALSRYYDLTGRKRLVQFAHDRKSAAVYSAFTTVGYHFYRVGGTTLTYSQGASRGILGHYPGIPPATDCSGFVTAIYKAVGRPDPNGFRFSPVGYTGTLAQHGVRVTNWHALKPGDLVFYGGGFPYGHVAMVVNGFLGLVVSHGSRGVKLLAYNYRRVSVVRRYYS
jgi:cell wall-associated NlpC family hydrolase